MLRICAVILAAVFFIGGPTTTSTVSASEWVKPWDRQVRRRVIRRRTVRRARPRRVQRRRAARRVIRQRSRVRLSSLNRRPVRRNRVRTAKKKKPNPKFPPGAAVWDGGPKPKTGGKAPPVVRFRASYPKNTIIISHNARKLYYTLGGGRAFVYPVAVGREGFQWFGKSRISRKVSWPDWRPPKEMRERKPNLPKLMTGGLYNPLGAKALYLGSSLYRIHGTPNPGSVGSASSSGCFRMYNSHV
ncbi:MAG: L,D-transpeptidase, partial [Pseudomonadota bacterium]